jgi:hypothetical protein
MSGPVRSLPIVFESINLRDESVPDLVVVVRLGSNTRLDEHLARNTEVPRDLPPMKLRTVIRLGPSDSGHPRRESARRGH